MSLENKLLETLGEALTTSIQEQMGHAWAFDNLDTVITDELKLLTTKIIREDPVIHDAVRNRLLDLVDPLPPEEEGEDDVEPEPEPTPKASKAKPKTKKS